MTPAFVSCFRTLLFVATGLSLAGCHVDMRDQPRYEPLEASNFFADGLASRPVVEGTIARGQLNENKARYAGRTDDGALTPGIAIDIDEAGLARGQVAFKAYCSHCHGLGGDGQGMVVLRGFRRPPSYHSDRLREAPSGHFFDVITNGLGVMPSLKTQVDVDDRWKIVAYIRALQLSRNAAKQDVPQSELNKLLTEAKQ